MAKACANHPESMAVAFCVKCGLPMCPACEHPVEGRPFCRECLDIRRREQLVQSIQNLQPSEETVAKVKSAAAVPLRNKEVRRVAALFIDLAVILGGALPVSMAIYGLSFLVLPVVHGLPFSLSFYLAVLLTGSIYYMVAHWKYGRTVGKKIMGLRVVRTDGGRVTPGGAFWRLTGFLAVFIWAAAGWKVAGFAMDLIARARHAGAVDSARMSSVLIIADVVLVLFGLFFSLGVIITFVGKHKRGFHDIVGGTIVVGEGFATPHVKVEPALPDAGGRGARRGG